MGIKRTVLSFADRDSWQRRCGDGVHEITVLAKTMAKRGGETARMRSSPLFCHSSVVLIHVY